jgi:hypothetical protein
VRLDGDRSMVLPAFDRATVLTVCVSLKAVLPLEFGKAEAASVGWFGDHGGADAEWDCASGE